VSTLVVAPTLFGSLGDEPTLDDQLVGAWEGLIAHRAVECIVCHGRMEPEYGSGAREPEGGRCSSCGATLR